MYIVPTLKSVRSLCLFTVLSGINIQEETNCHGVAMYWKNQSGNHMKTATEIVFILSHILPSPWYSIILLVLILFVFHFHLSSYSSWMPLLTQLVVGIWKMLRNTSLFRVLSLSYFLPANNTEPILLYCPRIIHFCGSFYVLNCNKIMNSAVRNFGFTLF